MPRRRDRLMDYLARRDMARGRDMRNPYGSRGGYVNYRRDRGMDYEYDMARGDRAGDMARGRDYGDYEGGDMARGGGRGRGRDRAGDYADYGDMARGGRGRDRGEDYGDYESDMARGGRGRDGHYPMGQGSTYYPIEAMGRFNGYWGMPQEDYRGRGRDMGYYDMRGGRRDYGEDYGDYGESLTMEELEHWRKKLDKEVGDEQSKHFFKKENVEMKAKQMGIEMKGFNAEELALASYMLYSDFCDVLKPYFGGNMDAYIKLGKAFLTDPDSEVKGGMKLALYHEIVSGEMDD